jgi:hypothetical protein
MSGQRVSQKQVERTFANLSKSEQSTIEIFKRFHFASGSQVGRIRYNDPMSEANTRNRNRILKNLAQYNLLVRLPRQERGGSLHGSNEFLYTLSSYGQRVMWPGHAVTRPLDSSPTLKEHIEHAIEVTEMYAQLSEAKFTGKIIGIPQALGEPSSHVQFETIFREKRTVKADARFLFTYMDGNVQYDSPWFIEVERTKQSELLTIEKIRTYVAYESSLKEGEHMPLVLFVTFSPAHKAFIDNLLDLYADYARRLFYSATMENAITTMLSVQG